MNAYAEIPLQMGKFCWKWGIIVYPIFPVLYIAGVIIGSVYYDQWEWLSSLSVALLSTGLFLCGASFVIISFAAAVYCVSLQDWWKIVLFQSFFLAFRALKRQPRRELSAVVDKVSLSGVGRLDYYCFFTTLAVILLILFGVILYVNNLFTYADVQSTGRTSLQWGEIPVMTLCMFCFSGYVQAPFLLYLGWKNREKTMTFCLEDVFLPFIIRQSSYLSFVLLPLCGLGWGVCFPELSGLGGVMLGIALYYGGLLGAFSFGEALVILAAGLYQALKIKF